MNSVCSALQGPSEEHVLIVGDKNCNLQDASTRYDLYFQNWHKLLINQGHV